MAQVAGGCSVSANCVPQVVQMKFGMMSAAPVGSEYSLLAPLNLGHSPEQITDLIAVEFCDLRHAVNVAHEI